MKNKLAYFHKLIFDKIVNRTHSHTAFSKYVINTMLDRYSYDVYTPSMSHLYCGRTYM